MLKTNTYIKKEAKLVLELIDKKPKNQDIDSITRNIIDLKLNIINNFNYFSKIEKFLLAKKSLVHGDFHHDNILFNKNNNVTGIIDLDEIHYGHPMEDIMHFIHLICFNKDLGKVNIEKAEVFFREYINNNNLNEEEIIIGIHLYIYQICSSFFLEKKLYNSSYAQIIRLIERDKLFISYFFTNINEFLEKILPKEF